MPINESELKRLITGLKQEQHNYRLDGENSKTLINTYANQRSVSVLQKVINQLEKYTKK